VVALHPAEPLPLPSGLMGKVEHGLFRPAKWNIQQGIPLSKLKKIWAAAGLSPVVRGCRKAGPAGLRGLLKSPPHLAGQASAPLRATRFNPCRGRSPTLNLFFNIPSPQAKPPHIQRCNAKPLKIYFSKLPGMQRIAHFFCI
jgi:hypothetical protein